MTHTQRYKATSAKLLAMGTTCIPTYLEKAFPPISPHNSSSPVPLEFSLTALGLTQQPLTSSVETSIPDDQAEDNVQEQMDLHVPFYIKVKGKGKGRRVLYDAMKSSVAQIYGR